MTVTAPLVIAIDSTQVEKGKKSLQDLAAQGKNTESSFNQFKKATLDQKAALSDLLGKIDPTVAALGRLDTLQKELVKNKAKGFIDAETFNQYNTTLETSRKNLSRFTEAQNGSTKSTKELAFALRGVPAQFTDIAVSLQGGQKPLTVLLQQGGQLKDMFGGVGAATRALGSYVLGLLNPFSIAAVAVGGLAFAFYENSQRINSFNKALITSGNLVGSSAGQLNALSQKIGAISGHYSDARDAVTQLAASGVIGSKNLEVATRGVVDGVALTGRSVQDLVKDFALLAKDPVKGLLQLNEGTNFLTASTYEQVKALIEQGKTQEAVTLATKTYQQTVSSRNGEVLNNLGSIELGWLAIKKATLGAVEAALGIGRVKTNLELLADAREKLKKSQGAPTLTFGGNTDFVDTSAIKREIAARQSTEDIAVAKARAAGVIAVDKAQKLNAQTFLDDARKNSANLNKGDALTAAIKAKRAEFAPAIEAYKNDVVKLNEVTKLRDQAIANLQDKGSSGRKGRSSSGGGINRDNQLIQSDLDVRKSIEALSNQRATTVDENLLKNLTRQHDAQLISDVEFYNKKYALQLDQLTKQKSGYDKEINDLVNAKKRLNQVQQNELIVKLNTLTGKSDDVQNNINNLKADNATEYLKKVSEATKSYTDANNSSADSLRKSLEAQQKHTRELGLTAEQIDKLNEVRYLDIAATYDTAAASAAAGAELFKEDEARKQLFLTIEAQARLNAQLARDNAKARTEDQAAQKVNDFRKQQEKLAANVQKSFEEFFFDPFKKGLGGLVDSFSNAVRRMAAEAAAAQLSKYLFGSIVKGGEGDGILGQVFGSLIKGIFSPSAKGNAFNNQGVMAFASGGIVSSATPFSYGGGNLGVMGEKGPEAILPLRRGAGGKLGVELSGASEGSTTINLVMNVSTPDANSFRQSQSQILADANRTLSRGRRNL